MNTKQLLIQPDILTEGEQAVLADVFNNPTVVKYLKILGREAVLELASLTALTEVSEGLARKHVFVDGKLAVITTLLSISQEK